MKKLFQYLIQHWRLTLAILAVLIVLTAILVLVRSCTREEPLSIESSKDINLTPAQITSIKKIGKWEFLSMQMEEIVDTTNKHWILRDDELIRIYHGTIRLGVDMETLADDWFRAQGDTAIIVLPPIKTLDDKFINEAQTQTFYENGSWDGKAREALYRKAERRMRRRLVESKAYQRAEENGEQQVRALMRTLGFKTTIVHFSR